MKSHKRADNRGMSRSEKLRWNLYGNSLKRGIVPRKNQRVAGAPNGALNRNGTLMGTLGTGIWRIIHEKSTLLFYI